MGLFLFADKEFRFFAGAKLEDKHFPRRRQQQFVHAARPVRADSHAPHAGNATRFIGLVGVIQGDCSRRAGAGTRTALHAGFGSCRLKRNRGVGFVRAVAFYRGSIE